MNLVNPFRLVLCTASLISGLCAHAQLFNFEAFNRAAAALTATARQEPAHAVVGQPCAILLELETDEKNGIEDLQVSGLPDADSGAVLYGDGFETLADRPSGTKGRILKRFRLPVRFLAPLTNACTLTLQGMSVTRRKRGSMSFTSSQNFLTRARPFQFNVQSLPEEGRPAAFSGAVGTHFSLHQSLSPARVHPGDLITATYTLTFNGYCPTNLVPRLTSLGPAFKTYEIKEVERTDRRIVWTQMLVPLTTDASHTAALSLDYYDLAAARYRRCDAQALPLVFISREAASTENTSRVVNTQSAKTSPAAPANAAPITLRFAPSENAPVLAIVPPGTPVIERVRTKNGWRRLETPHAIGWSRP